MRIIIIIIIITIIIMMMIIKIKIDVMVRSVICNLACVASGLRFWGRREKKWKTPRPPTPHPPQNRRPPATQATVYTTVHVCINNRYSEVLIFRKSKSLAKLIRGKKSNHVQTRSIILDLGLRYPEQSQLLLKFHILLENYAVARHRIQHSRYWHQSPK